MRYMVGWLRGYLQKHFLTAQAIRRTASKQMTTMRPINQPLIAGSWRLKTHRQKLQYKKLHPPPSTIMWFFVSDQWGNTYIACHLPVVPIHILRTFALADNGSGVPIEPGGVWCEVQRIGRALSRYIYQVTNLWFGNHTTQYSHGLFYGPTQHPPKMMPTSYTSQIVESGTLRSLCSQLQSAFVRQSCPSFSRQLQISLINIDQK